jgi:hypothetical protein
MPKIAFYHQQRFDGGVRAGLGVDDQTVLHRFEPGREPSNPALEWYVDVIVTGRSLPTSSDEARDWLIEHADFIRRGMGKAAEQLEVGLDTDDDAWPFRWKLGGGRAESRRLRLSPPSAGSTRVSLPGGYSKWPTNGRIRYVNWSR